MTAQLDLSAQHPSLYTRGQILQYRSGYNVIDWWSRVVVCSHSVAGEVGVLPWTFAHVIDNPARWGATHPRWLSAALARAEYVPIVEP